MQLRNRARLAAVFVLLLCASCHTLQAAVDAIVALPEEAATALFEAPWLDLEELLGILLRLIGL